MAGRHHRCNGHELGQTLGDGEGQRGLACCSPWGCKESDTTGRLNDNRSTVYPNTGRKLSPASRGFGTRIRKAVEYSWLSLTVHFGALSLFPLAHEPSKATVTKPHVGTLAPMQ